MNSLEALLALRLEIQHLNKALATIGFSPFTDPRNNLSQIISPKELKSLYQQIENILELACNNPDHRLRKPGPLTGIKYDKKEDFSVQTLEDKPRQAAVVVHWL